MKGRAFLRWTGLAMASFCNKPGFAFPFRLNLVARETTGLALYVPNQGDDLREMRLNP